jgi:hypothetical protein
VIGILLIIYHSFLIAIHMSVLFAYTTALYIQISSESFNMRNWKNC